MSPVTHVNGFPRILGVPLGFVRGTDFLVLSI
nr:MAG TPA: hypothetical protein [Caudoviricetes sp.]